MTRPISERPGRRPLRPPPPPSVLRERGLGMMKMLRVGNEDADEALRRAQVYQWAPRIAEKRPYTSTGYWVFLVKVAA